MRSTLEDVRSMEGLGVIRCALWFPNGDGVFAVVTFEPTVIPHAHTVAVLDVQFHHDLFRTSVHKPSLNLSLIHI